MAIAKTNAGWQGVKKINKSLESRPGGIPGSRRLAAGPKLYHKNDVIVPGNRPGSRRYVGKLNQDLDWRDELIEVIVEGIISGTIKAPFKIGAAVTGLDIPIGMAKWSMKKSLAGKG